MVQKKIIGALGIWLLISAIILRSMDTEIINILIVGVIATISGLTLTAKKTFPGWIGAVLGLWLIVSAFIPSTETIPCKYCNTFLIGAIFIVIGIIKFKKEVNLTKPYNYNNKMHTHRN